MVRKSLFLLLSFGILSTDAFCQKGVVDSYERTKTVSSTKICVEEIESPSTNSLIVAKCDAGTNTCGKAADGTCNTKGECTQPASCYSDPAKSWSCELKPNCDELCGSDPVCKELCKGYNTKWSASIEDVCGCFDKKAIDARNKTKEKNNKECQKRAGKEAKICVGFVNPITKKCEGKSYSLGAWACQC